MLNGTELKSRKMNGLTWTTSKDIIRVFDEQFAAKVEELSPVIDIWGDKYIRTKELFDLAEDDSSILDSLVTYNDDSSVYDLYDSYLSSSHHIIAASTLIEMFQLDVESFSEEFLNMMTNVNPTFEELRKFRKEIIEKIMEKSD